MNTCTRCGAAFGCTMADGTGAPCWCTRLAALAALPAAGSAAGCWCPACLEQHIALLAATAPAIESPAG